MTKEEVIKILKCLLGEKDSPLTDEQCEDEGFVESVYDEAIRVAIKALEEQTKITWSNKDLQRFTRYCKNTGYACEFATEYGYCQLTVCVKGR